MENRQIPIEPTRTVSGTSIRTWGDSINATQLQPASLITCYLFSLHFQFSEAGFDKLKSLLKPDTCHHVVSFTYVVPALLKTGKYLPVVS